MESPMSVALGDWLISRRCLLHLCLVSFVLDLLGDSSHIRISIGSLRGFSSLPWLFCVFSLWVLVLPLGFGGMTGVNLSSDAASPLMNAPPLSVLQLLILVNPVSLITLFGDESSFQAWLVMVFEEGSGFDAQFRLFGMLSRLQILLLSSFG
ncbi:unnamed protein product [Arabis nemorensis]|uniref:Uncharacterized protein n=1 Tax=Arabis nemorensis TaxID=586526 RepID=A0A565BTK7_9BRAS|nr:unnamed protein product [Arabis nemorensis]